MRCDVVAVGTELLLGQIVDTNSAWLGENLAANGIDSLLQVKVGDNLGRVESVLRSTLGQRRCGDRVRWPRPDARRPHPRGDRRGDGRRAGHDDAVADVITNMFASRGRYMAANNLRQAHGAGRRNRSSRRLAARRRA